jgi:beta-glucanase (GH16 family)
MTLNSRINSSRGMARSTVLLLQAVCVSSFLVAQAMTAAVAAPVVTGNDISWPDDGWYQVQSTVDYSSVCDGGRSCTVEPGTYIVINHTTMERFESIRVGGSSSPITVVGDVIRWPDDGWYQVQDATTYETVCDGTRSCQTGIGIYNVINHSTNTRYESIVVSDPVVIVEPEPEPTPNAVTVVGSNILWPDDGWYQVQNASTLAEVCQGGSSCTVADGIYIVINLTTNTRFEGVVVGEVVEPVEPIPSPSFADPFGSLLELDTEVAVFGGPPTQPKNLRLDLVSNNWAEFSWAPANDDGTVVQYNIYRSDGVIYRVRQDQTDPASGTQTEIDKYWQTTSFIDCNFTRFDQRLHQCSVNQPNPGQTYSYQVTAIDDDGLESAASDSLEITYLAEQGAPITPYRDFYRPLADTFVDDADLAEVPNWLNEFDLVFSDEFNGDSIDASKWNTSLTWGDSRIINGEQQYFVNTQGNPDFGYDPFSFTGESMVINAIPITDQLRTNLPAVCDEVDPTGLDRCEFLSGALSSHDKFQFIYGYTEGRFKVSGTPGALSSFYLYHRYAGAGVNYHAPEIDIVEYLGENPFGDEDAFQTYHFGDPNKQDIIRSAPTMAQANPDGGNYSDNDEWHTFGVLWEPQLVIWYIDGVEVKRLFGPQVSRQPMNIVNYLVAGSAWAPTPDATNVSLFPMQFEADYIRVYQREEFQSTATFGQ